MASYAASPTGPPLSAATTTPPSPSKVQSTIPSPTLAPKTIPIPPRPTSPTPSPHPAPPPCSATRLPVTAVFTPPSYSSHIFSRPAVAPPILHHLCIVPSCQRTQTSTFSIVQSCHTP